MPPRLSAEEALAMPWKHLGRRLYLQHTIRYCSTRRSSGATKFGLPQKTGYEAANTLAQTGESFLIVTEGTVTEP